VRWFDPDFLAGDLTDAERAFLLDTDTGTTEYTQTSLEGFVTGDVMDLPAGTLSAAIGAFYQRDEILDRPSDTTLTGNQFFGSQAGITGGVQSTTAIFGEVIVPVVQSKPLIESFDISASARYSEIQSEHEDGRNVLRGCLNSSSQVSRARCVKMASIPVSAMTQHWRMVIFCRLLLTIALQSVFRETMRALRFQEASCWAGDLGY